MVSIDMFWNALKYLLQIKWVDLIYVADKVDRLSMFDRNVERHGNIYRWEMTFT